MRKKRGLNEFKFVLTVYTIEEIIEESLKIAKRHEDNPPWGPANSWNHFIWSFGNAWRNMHNLKIYGKLGGSPDIAATFPIGDVLTQDQLKCIAVTLNIKGPYIPEKYT